MLLSGEIIVSGEKLGKDEVKIVKELCPKVPTMEAASEGELNVILDTVIYPEFQREGVLREISNRVQQLRKNLKLKAIDDIDVYYAFTATPTTDDGKLLYDVFVNDKSELEKVLKSALFQYSGPAEKNGTTNGEAMGEEREEGFVGEKEQDIYGTKFWLKLVRADARRTT
eukprot:TRINITY_DN80048_c0_g1_i1.p1 TRINITY_DN80048_c0_g1~~TRINITY_DN80048_c0_g1_i1.p1  ORF type:complete len:178 (+),score=25.65 TRINITY_DN80048_c0_g1_i1:25-534(+)